MILIISLILFLGKALGATYSFWWPMGFLIFQVACEPILDTIENMVDQWNKRK